MKKVINLVLLIVARAMQLILSPILLSWGFVRSVQKGEFFAWSKDMALGIDRFGNCMGKYAFNDLLGIGFGNGKETISSRLGKNERDNTQKSVGEIAIFVLDAIEKNHCKKAIDEII